jgi:hypothetical protein
LKLILNIYNHWYDKHTYMSKFLYSFVNVVYFYVNINISTSKWVFDDKIDIFICETSEIYE